ncbi:MAG TPA: tyrosine-type recombinase/integrase [Solirubrobacterales bacterium]|jgi:integrase|nr:tyrosine-type recombinase/integrase [Solirubrobacterales bacterium]
MIEAAIRLNGRQPVVSGAKRNFYRDVWKPTQEPTGIDIRPHECRHSYVTYLRAAGINDADLAEIAEHSVETMLARYTHPVGEGSGGIRAVIG